MHLRDDRLLSTGVFEQHQTQVVVQINESSPVHRSNGSGGDDEQQEAPAGVQRPAKAPGHRGAAVAFVAVLTAQLMSRFPHVGVINGNVGVDVAAAAVVVAGIAAAAAAAAPAGSATAATAQVEIDAAAARVVTAPRQTRANAAHQPRRHGGAERGTLPGPRAVGGRPDRHGLESACTAVGGVIYPDRDDAVAVVCLSGGIRWVRRQHRRRGERSHSRGGSSRRQECEAPQ